MSEPKETDLSQMASRSVAWSYLSMASKSGIRFVTTAIIARILTPADFGTVGMARIITEIIALFGNLGLGAAIIHRQDLDKEHLSTCFWVNLTLGVVLCLTTIAFAPWGATFFRNPMVKDVATILSFSFVIGPLGTINGLLLTKNLRFREIAIIEIISNVLQVGSSLTLVIVFKLGLWGIVFSMIISDIASTSLKHAFTFWLPSRVFNFSKFKQLFRYGRNLFAESFLNYFSSNIDYLLTGRLLGPSLLGYYQFAYGIPHMTLSHFSRIITRVLFPVLSRVQDDTERFQRGYLKTITFISMVTFPAMLGLFVIAREFIYVVYGERWLPVVLPLQLLCFSGMVKSILTTNGSVFNSKGRPDIGLKWTIFVLPIVVFAVFWGSRYGVVGVATAMMVTSFLSFVAAKMAISLVNLRFKSYLKALRPASIGAGVMAIVVFVFKRMISKYYSPSQHVLLFSSFFVGVVVYGAVMRFFFSKQFLDLVTFIKNSFFRRNT